ncbi:DeoR/GlpR family DNA-binding transcription regulator [Reinekea marinisedimentorum]|uniref:DeoR/GlpR family transcriptional regulator of sugar metabolism n=1 Tax=Reinekea marinisedimentorum TaxID=230495 RepID=A0A4R3I741_9GAMM|nr:DeoR/GlpR family DNA-binding transcription regulator [Reinekea marinisedimentorum]TCS41049.1 DeoR/GlpR family transcriptional regulator of sugar metabolism [Reinekea marinisedimentorum]
MPNPRQEKLLKQVIDQGYCTVEDLAESLDVSTQTIRRDIKKLSDERLIVRHHGGASSPSSTVNLDYEIRKVSETDEKNAIAERIADLIPDSSTVFLTIGTTTEIIATHLLKRNNLQVITNSLRVANVLHGNKTFDVLIPSGKIRANNGGIIGTDAVDFVNNFRFDYLITSAGSIDADGTLLEYDLNESAIARAAMKSARNVFVALDSTKYTPKGSIELCHISEATTLFTDEKPPQDIQEVLNQSEVRLEVCK